MTPTAISPSILESNHRSLTATYALSSGQKALWFQQQMPLESMAYHLCKTVRITSKLSIALWYQTWQKLTERHSMLRTTYTIEDGEPVQVVHPHLDVPLGVIDTSLWSDAELKTEIISVANRPFDLAHEPALRVYLFQRSLRDYIQLISLHKIGGDLWSLNILLAEFRRLYGRKDGVPTSGV
ncbi:MAG: condensation domain-containing protein, partial [Coleofasciculus sp. C2-GNP5-27]